MDEYVFSLLPYQMYLIVPLKEASQLRVHVSPI